MESTARSAGIDLAKKATYPGLALVLALLSVPGSTFAWDSLPGGGFAFGWPPAIAAVALGVAALRDGTSGRGKAIAAVVIAGAVMAMMVAWTVVGVVS